MSAPKYDHKFELETNKASNNFLPTAGSGSRLKGSEVIKQEIPALLVRHLRSRTAPRQATSTSSSQDEVYDLNVRCSSLHPQPDFKLSKAACKKQSYEGPEHYKKFLQCLSSASTVKCATCRQLRDRVLQAGQGLEFRV